MTQKCIKMFFSSICYTMSLDSLQNTVSSFHKDHFLVESSSSVSKWGRRVIEHRQKHKSTSVRCRIWMDWIGPLPTRLLCNVGNVDNFSFFTLITITEEPNPSAVGLHVTSLYEQCWSSFIWFTIAILELLILHSHKQIHYLIAMHPANSVCCI